MTDLKNRKVTVVSRLYTPEVGAASFRLEALVDGLIEAGAEVNIVTTKAPVNTRSFKPAYRISRWPVLRDSSGSVRGYVQYLSFDLPMFFRILLGRRPDVFVVEPPPTSGFIVLLVSRLRRIPFVYFSADVSSSAARGIGVSAPIVAVLTSVERGVLKSAASVLAVSVGVQREVERLTSNQTRVVNVGTGVDTRVFAFEGPIMSNEGRYFVYAGTMSEIHGASVFVDAFLSLTDDYPDVQLVMFGQGVELAELRDKARGYKVNFHETVDGQELAKWHRGSVANLASVRPGKGYDFAFATKALAGLAAGSPVIYAGVGPMSSLVRDNQLGISCAWEVGEVASAMRLMLDHPIDDVRRLQLSLWVKENYSLRAVGAAAAKAVLGTISGSGAYE